MEINITYNNHTLPKYLAVHGFGYILITAYRVEHPRGTFVEPAQPFPHVYHINAFRLPSLHSSTYTRKRVVIFVKAHTLITYTEPKPMRTHISAASAHCAHTGNSWSVGAVVALIGTRSLATNQACIFHALLGCSTGCSGRARVCGFLDDDDGDWR